jgi:hypothetical protein
VQIQGFQAACATHYFPTVVLVVCLKLNGGVQDARLNRSHLSHTDSLRKPEAKGPVAGRQRSGVSSLPNFKRHGTSHAPLSRGLANID